jgi:hypothetical protein
MIKSDYLGDVNDPQGCQILLLLRGFWEQLNQKNNESFKI